MADNDPADQLKKLADLRKQGVLSEAEFSAAKAKVLGSGPAPTGRVAHGRTQSQRTAGQLAAKKTGCFWGLPSGFVKNRAGFRCVCGVAGVRRWRR